MVKIMTKVYRIKLTDKKRKNEAIETVTLMLITNL